MKRLLLGLTGGLASGTCEMDIYNCIFRDNQAGPSGGNIFRNNYGCINLNNSIVDLADCSALNAGSGKAVVCNNTLFATDPLFEDIHSDDFTLKSASPAIEAGDNSFILSNSISIDLACNPRIDGALVDIGAYEMCIVAVQEVVTTTLELYPNPTSKLLTVHFPDQIPNTFIIQVFNNEGKMIQQQMILPKGLCRLIF